MGGCASRRKGSDASGNQRAGRAGSLWIAGRLRHCAHFAAADPEPTIEDVFVNLVTKAEQAG
jgi:hypothetical protein